MDSQFPASCLLLDVPPPPQVGALSVSPAALAVRLLPQAEALPSWPLLLISRAGPQRLPGSHLARLSLSMPVWMSKGFV